MYLNNEFKYIVIFILMSEETIYIPIDFWYSQKPLGLALPLVKLCYNEVKIELEHIKPKYWEIRKYTHIEFKNLKSSTSENFNNTSFYGSFF